ncbi:MAG: hypothetical protein JWL70_160, partial [Acidimicrobiia bacterium]|nr:hypothetical protein [Acidimicrobiia bacterium]
MLLIGCSSSRSPAATTTTASTSPPVTSGPAATTRPAFYVVTPGDSLAAIANRFGLTRNELFIANGIT